LSCAICAASSGGRSSTGEAPGRRQSLIMASMSLLSLLTMLRVTLSTSSGAVQRPLKPGRQVSYTCLQEGVGRQRLAQEQPCV
jgi:hypothetical protein